MAILMWWAFAYQLTGNAVHELIGTAILFMVVSHNIVSRRWYGVLGKGKFGVRRIVNIAVNLLLLVTALPLFLSGLANSHVWHLISAAQSTMMPRQVHVLAAYWVLMLVSVHLGIHWKMVMSECCRLLGIDAISPIGIAIIRSTAIILITFGIYAFFERNIFLKLFAYYSFDYWDFSKSITGFLARYLAIMCLYAGLTHYGLKFFRK